MSKYFYIGLILLGINLYSCATITTTQEKETINQIIDDWHKAAAKADEEVFFGTFAPNGIYIGTDETELWTANELKEWSEKYFERESAWSFSPHDRNIYFSQNGKVAWFDELLDTWMGSCRGSGVIEKINGKWKLQHYHLAIAVPNDVVQDYLKLIEKKKN